jgi:tetratricopeptide (TPR) repeat protein
VLQAKGQRDEAIACYKKAITLDPKYPPAHFNLGTALQAKGQLDDAIACYKKAIELDPKLSAAHGALGTALKRKGEVDEAITCYKKAIALDPKDARPHLELGIALGGKGQLDAAIACFRNAIALDPKLAPAHANLGAALARKGELDEAIACFKMAIELNPRDAMAHCYLGHALRKQGQFAEALAALKRGHELGTQQPGWRYPSAEWVRQAERLAAPGKLVGPVHEVGQGLELRGKLEERTPALVYQVKLASGKIYAIDMVSPDQKALDPYLVLSDAKGKTLAEDDDSGGGLNARILYRAAQDGTFRISATSFNGGSGAFTLTVREQLQPPGGKKDADQDKEEAAKVKLAMEHLKAGKKDQALPLLVEVFNSKKTRLGPDHAETLESMNMLGVVYWQLGQFDKSVPLFEKLLKSREAKHGRDHPDTLRAVANLGVNYKDAGKLKEAIGLLEEAHRAARKDPKLTWVVNPLLDAYARAGENPKLANLVQEVLPAARKALPADSPQLAGLLAQGGMALLNLKKWAEAEPLLRECLTIREKTQPDIWATFNAKSMLGGVMLGQKKYAEAEPLLLAGYEGMKKREKTIPPPGRPRLVEAVERLVQLYEALGKKDEVARWTREREAIQTPAKKLERKP